MAGKKGLKNALGNKGGGRGTAKEEATKIKVDATMEKKMEKRGDKAFKGLDKDLNSKDPDVRARAYKIVFDKLVATKTSTEMDVVVNNIDKKSALDLAKGIMNGKRTNKRRGKRSSEVDA